MVLGTQNVELRPIKEEGFLKIPGSQLGPLKVYFLKVMGKQKPEIKPYCTPATNKLNPNQIKLICSTSNSLIRETEVYFSGER